MTLKKGQVSFHNSHTIHCSYPNTSEKNRLALAVHLQDGDNKYKEAFNDKGEKIVIGYDKICRKDKNGKPLSNKCGSFRKTCNDKCVDNSDCMKCSPEITGYCKDNGFWSFL